MKINQLIKKLNNTELGKSGTHETYVLIPQNLDITQIFEKTNEVYNFIDRKSNEIFKLRKTVGREIRVVGLGTYYNKYKICAGDELLLEKQEYNGTVKYVIDVKKYKNGIILQCSKSGAEVLNIDRIKDKFYDGSFSILVMYKNVESTLQIKYLLSKKKRSDSPKETEFYDLLINGESIVKKYKSSEILQLKIYDNYNVLTRVNTCEISNFQFGEED